MQKLQQISESYEDLFIRRYGRLLDWSLQLTRHDRDEAEDLLHDAFIQFTLGRPDLEAIENLDGYLYAMLRNMRLSRVRRAARGPVALPSLIDYDSAELSLRAADERTRIHVQDEIGRVCHYACIRKETSKAGSVLILRFFHGYYPSEIAQVMQSQRRAVDDWLRISRREARVFLDDPRRLNFLGDREPARTARIGLGLSTVDFMRELRCAIYRSRRSKCLTGTRLRELYGSGHTGPADCAILAHIVSCPQCLDEVNRLLGLSPLRDRFPTDMLGPDSRSQGGGGGGPVTLKPVGTLIKKAQRRSRDVFEHRPKELRISVNGFILGSQKVNSDLSEHSLTVNLDEKIGFVEVLSEQDVRLLFLSVTPPPEGRVEQSLQVALSDDRSLELSLDFSGRWPDLKSVYHDPSLKPVSLSQTHLRVGSLTVREGLEIDFSQEKERELKTETPLPFQLFKTALLERTTPWRRWLRPGFVTAMFAVLVISSVLLVKMRVTPVSAAELLDRASASEDKYAARPDIVAHRWLEFEERKLSGSEPPVKRRIEVWSNPARGVGARRLYDEGGKLIAGEWTDSGGVRTVYQEGTASRSAGVPELQARIESGNVWLLEPSARLFSNLTASMEAALVEEGSARYLIKYRGEREIRVGVLLSAALTLDAYTLRPVEQILVVRRDGEEREFRFRESSYKYLPLETVPPKVFQPDEGLVSKAVMRAGPIIARDEVAASGDAEVAPAGVVTKDMELEAMYQLHRIGACMREQPAITRAGGQLQIQALTQTEGRKEELLEALNPVMNSSPLRVEVKTVSEAVKDQTPMPSGPVRRIQITRGRIPVHDILHDHFSDKEPLDEAVEENIRKFAGQMIARSRRVLLHAWALNHLVKQFSPEEVRGLSPETQARWRAMIEEHARSFRKEAREMRLGLEPVFFASSAGQEPEGIEAADSHKIVESIFRVALSQEETLRNAFAISNGGETSQAIKSERFRLSLIRAERLAERLEAIN
ncbi:MAG: RNA polymerase sigma factor [Blastocatellia bacterium]|nr:RNA polymerase sigma factor [Blastocatellia bacterium]